MERVDIKKVSVIFPAKFLNIGQALVGHDNDLAGIVPKPADGGHADFQLFQHIITGKGRDVDDGGIQEKYLWLPVIVEQDRFVFAEIIHPLGPDINLEAADAYQEIIKILDVIDIQHVSCPFGYPLVIRKIFQTFNEIVINEDECFPG